MSVSEQLGERRQVALKAGTVHYRERGEGPTLVFVHGFGVNGDVWRKVVEPLSERNRCIAPDWPLGSHPEAMKPDADLSMPGLAKLIVEFLDALELQDVTLIGNDSGGALSQLVVTHHPERIGRLVLTSCDAYECCPPPPFPLLQRVAKLPGSVTMIAQSMRIRASRRMPLAYGWVMHKQPERAISDSYALPMARDKAVRHDMAKVLGGLSPKHTLAAAKRFAKFQKPVLVAWAADEKLFPRSLGERLAADFPNARLEIVDGSRTFISEDQPQALIALIDSFVGAGSSAVAVG